MAGGKVVVSLPKFVLEELQALGELSEVFSSAINKLKESDLEKKKTSIYLKEPELKKFQLLRESRRKSGQEILEIVLLKYLLKKLEKWLEIEKFLAGLTERDLERLKENMRGFSKMQQVEVAQRPDLRLLLPEHVVKKIYRLSTSRQIDGWRIVAFSLELFESLPEELVNKVLQKSTKTKPQPQRKALLDRILEKEKG